MKRKYIKWEKLDNTANIFPVIAGESMTNTYRISVVLKDEIDPVKLQETLSIVLPKFPGFNLRLRTGVFWYYFEENGKKAPKVKEESEYPCRFIHANRNNSYMFSVTYYKNRINLEAFHALADGMGGIGFLREITYQYIRLLNPDLRKKLGDELSEDTSLDRDDSFVRNYKKANASQYKSKKAYLIKGEKLPYGGFGTICGFLSVSQLKKISKEKYHTSINNYLIACFIYAIYQANHGKITKKHPVRIAVPVNLRPYFLSNTTKNFFAMISAEFYPKKNEYSFEDIMEITKNSIESQKTKENLEAIFSYNVSNSEILAARAVPLPIKNLAMLYVYNRAAMANTTTITNIGNVKVLPEYEDYIENFYSFLPFSKGQNLKATISSYKDSLVLGFSTRFIDTTVPKLAFRQMTQDGADLSIETNGEFYL